MKSKLHPLITAGVIACLGLAASAGQEKKQAAPARAPGASEDEVVRVDTSLVTVPVTVKDRGGKLAPACGEKTSVSTKTASSRRSLTSSRPK